MDSIRGKIALIRMSWLIRFSSGADLRATGWINVNISKLSTEKSLKFCFLRATLNSCFILHNVLRYLKLSLTEVGKWNNTQPIYRNKASCSRALLSARRSVTIRISRNVRTRHKREKITSPIE